VAKISNAQDGPQIISALIIANTTLHCHQSGERDYNAMIDAGLYSIYAPLDGSFKRKKKLPAWWLSTITPHSTFSAVHRLF